MNFKLFILGLFTSVLLFNLPALQAQEKNQSLYFGPPQDLGHYPILDQKFTVYSIYQLDLQSLQSILEHPESELDLQLQIGTQQWDWHLAENQARKQSLQIGRASSSKAATASNYEYKVYHGDAKIALTADRFYAQIPSREGTLYLEPLQLLVPTAAKHLFVAYYADAVIPDDSATCLFEEQQEAHRRLDHSPTGEESLEEKTECLITEIAVAADYSMVLSHGSVENVIAYLEMLLDGVSDIYTSHFDLAFLPTEYFVVDCSGCDPWTATNIAAHLLAEFRFWAEAGGFTASYDVATLWTRRGFLNGVVGTAYFSQVCRTQRFSVCRRISSVIQNTSLWAHELGHLFGASHDGAFDPYIMRPTLNSFEDFSTASVTAIDNKIDNSQSCLACPPDLVHEKTRRVFLGAPYGYWGVYTEVVNIGALPAAASQSGIYVSTDATLDASDIFIDSRPTAALNGGERAMLNGVFYYLPPSGTSDLFAIINADDGEEITEMDENNNWVAIRLIGRGDRGLLAKEQLAFAEEQTSLSLYPNPMTETLYVNWQTAEIGETEKWVEVWSGTGQLQYRRAVEAEAGQLEFNTSDLAAGIYFVQLKAGKQILEVQKIIRH